MGGLSIEDLVDYYNLMLTGNRLRPETIETIIETVETINSSDTLSRLRIATLLVTISIEYKTQQ